MGENCFFCELEKNGKGIIYSDLFFISRLDLFPVSPGHAEIIPRRHVVAFEDLTSIEWAVLQQSIRNVIAVIVNTDLKTAYQDILESPFSDTSAWFCQEAINHPRINTKPDAYNYGLNDGLAAGRTINHLHLHIIPRYSGDMTDPSGGVRYVIPDMGNYKIAR
jgi:ATP adenylyltransferase